ncbi:MAG TPA: DUF2169 domain-containing protein, partial [Gammaproteobacteria bacterium]|nr:DUF2169 domain-containing protein [Gammaproteobacteria bacterium]
MAHFKVNNETKLPFHPLFLADEQGQPIVTALCTGSFAIAAPVVQLLENQPDPAWEGVYHGEPGVSSLRQEPDTAFTKPATDVVLLGHARPAKPGDRSVDVGIKVGPVQKVARVFVDRYWVKTGGTVLATKPSPFEQIPLVYERAFGGWDRAHKDEKTWKYDPRNPVGRGFGDPLRYVEEGKVPLPNIEDPNHLINRYGDSPAPAGFGFISPEWQPRARYAGTYDEAWDRGRKPLLPKDFDLRFFSAASPGLVAPGYLTGDEEVVVVNAAPVPQLRFKLPGVAAPECAIELRSGERRTLHTHLDTVIVDTDAMVLHLRWRAHTR